MKHRDFIPSAFLEPLVNYLIERELDSSKLEQKMRTLMEVPSLCTIQFRELLEEIHDLSPTPFLGFRLGMAVNQRNFGFVGYLLFSCSNLRQALTRYRRFQRLLHTGIKSWVIDKGETLEMHWTQRIANTPLANEFSLAVFIRLYQSLIGKNIPPVRMSLPVAQTTDTVKFEALAGCPVRLGTDSLMTEIPTRLMSMRITGSDPHLRELLEKQAEAMLLKSAKDETGSPDFFELLQTHIISAMKDGDTSAEKVAQNMGYSSRSFYRKLNDEGYNYRSVLSDVRLRLARKYLADSNLSHTEIALLLGYSEQSSFIRAFRNWMGMTPGEFRDLLAKKAN